MNALSGLLLVLVSCCSCVRPCLGWTQAELDLFDLVEEIGQNFYDVLQVEQTASSSEIRRAYRRLSLQYHPDKNSEPDAAEKFRKIGAVAEVLRDEELRAMYDQVLVDGLPDWRQPIYYYRRVRKMSIWELSALLLAIATFAQFLYGWAQYFEKWLVLNELREKKARKEQRGTKTRKQTSLQLEAEIIFYTQLANDCIPHYSRLLPVVIVKKLFHFVTFYILVLKHSVVAAKQVLKGKSLWDESSKAAMNVTGDPLCEVQGKEHRPVNVAGSSKKEAKSLNGVCARERNKTKVSSRQQTGLTGSSNQEKNGYEREHPVSVDRDDRDKNSNDNREIEAACKPSSDLSGSDESTGSPTNATDLVKEDGLPLEKATRTTPPTTQGSTKSSKATPTSAVETHNRPNRTKSAQGTTASTKAVETKTENPTKVVDKTSMVVRDQTDNHKIQTELSDSAAVTQNIVPMSPSQTTQSKDDGGARTVLTDAARNSTADSRTGEGVWSQYQQQQLEWALRKYTRSADNRWQLIAENIPGKSEAECKKRFRTLVDAVHRKKSGLSTKPAMAH